MEEKRNHIQKARRTKKCGIITIILIAMIGIGILLQNQEIQERLGIKTEIKAANRITSVLQSDVSKDGTPLLSDDSAIITSANVLHRKTGTAPFDEEEGDGNDVSEEDDIIRSFDQIKYTIEANMGINNTDHGSEEGKQYSSFKGGTIYVEAKIPEQHKGLMHWDTGAMIWSEGTGKVSEDNLTFTAQYKMSDDIITVPGKQTVELVLKVDGANNGLEIESPSFKLWMQGNDSDEENEGYEAITIKDNKNAVRVTTKITNTAGYNLQLRRNEKLSKKTTLDYGKGNLEGRMYGYTLSLQLYNAETEKGLKGIEYPKGPITFDIDTKLEKVKNGITTNITSEATPILWNYRINENGEYGDLDKNPDYGNIADRNMYFGNSTGINLSLTPYGRKLITRGNSIYDSGEVEMIQNGSTIHTIVDDYGFDGIFPQTNATNNISYADNIGYFSVIYFQLFVPDTEASTDDNATYYLSVSNSNIKAISNSGKEITHQVAVNDDNLKIEHTITKQGAYENYIRIFDSKNSALPNTENGLNRVYQGEKIQLELITRINNNEDKEIKSMNKLAKFDGDSLRPILYEDGRQYKQVVGSMNFKMWYVTKKDGTNWNSQEERNQAKIEDLDIYETIEEIPEEKVCVGIYIESQEMPSPQQNTTLRFMLQVKEDAQIGNTYGITHRTKLWTEELDRTTQTIMNPDAIYPQAKWDDSEINYLKAEYDEEGNIITGTHSGGYAKGNSILVVGAEASIAASVNDKTEDKPKTIYDLSRNENEVNFVLNPVLTECDPENPTGQTGVTVKVKDVLPKGLSYVPGSSNYGEPTTIMESEDGTTTLIWEIYNCTVGEELKPLTFKAKIAETIATGTKLTNTAIIIPEREKVGLSHISFRRATYEIQVVNLASHRLYKEVNTPIIENNGMAKYTLTYQNSMNLSMPDFQLLDILPYNGDGRGSSYNGTYTIDHIEVKQTSGGMVVDNQNLSLYTTTNIEARTISPKDESIGISSIWNKREIGAVLSEPATVFAVKGEIAPNTKVEVEIYVKTQDNKPADVYANSATAQTSKETEVITTTAVKAQVVKRQIEGMIWYDTNGNGIKEEDENYAKGIEVVLKKADGTEAVDINGNPVANLRTNEQGEYHFMNLPIGEYQVEILTASKYQLTQKGVGTNLSINSKFEEIDGKKQSEVITKLNQINSPEMIQSYVNAGLVLKDTKVMVKYVDQETGNEITYLDENNQEQKYNYEINGKVEQEYLTEKKEIPNYVYLSDSKNTQGNMTEDTIEVIYYYAYNKQDITVHKIWEDNNNVAQKRPQSITLTLTGSDGSQLKQELNTNHQNVDNPNQWSDTFVSLPRYTESGEKIEYILNEESTGSQFYTKTSVNQETKTITNQFVQSTEKAQIEVTKIWDDNHNQAEKRPQNITIQMIGNGQTYEEVITGDRKAESWNYTFELPKYDENNNEISYTIAEKETGNRFYTKENTIINQENKMITNRFEVPNETIQIEVTKVWDDHNNRAGKRPNSVTIQMIGNGQTYQEVITGDKNTQTWGYTFEVPKYDENGNEIEYTIREENVENLFYTKENSTINQVTKTITNRFEVPDDKQAIKVSKIWDDYNNENGKRPEEVTLYLTGNGQEYSQTLTKEDASQENENNWEYTFEELPVYDTKGDRINYILDERPVNSEFYTKTGINQAQKTVTNQFGVPTESVQVQVNKVWEDESNQAGKRPNSITLQVKNGETVVKEETVIGNKTTNEGWSHRFEVPKYDKQGNEITYSIGEKEENKIYSNQIDQATRTITNYYETIDIAVNVVWNDNEIQAKRRPESILLQLKNGETEIARQEINGSNCAVEGTTNQWRYIFTGLQKYNESGNEIQYHVDETEKTEGDLKFYTKEINKITNKQFVINNTFTRPEDTTNVTITKVWNDNNDGAKKRPESVMLQVKNGTTKVEEAVVTATEQAKDNSNIWEHTFTDLEKYNENGEQIVYTADEAEVKSGDLQFYEKTISGTTLTNTFTQSTDQTTVIVTKNWVDTESQKTKRPESIILQVKSNNEVIQSKEVVVDKTVDTITETFEGLPKYDENNNIINYTVDEVEKEEGDLKFYTKNISGTTITNTFTKPKEKINVLVTKIWNDQNNTYGKRPEKIGLQIKIGDTLVEEKIVTQADKINDNQWSCSFQVEKYDENGNTINYTVAEREINPADLFYYTKTGETIQKDEAGNVTGNITNDMTKIPGMVEIKYVDKNTGEEIVEKVEKEGVIGESYDVAEEKKDLVGYTLIEEPEEKTGTYTKEKQEKVYYYAKNTKVVVKYLEKGTNQVLAEESEIVGYEGKEYKTEQKTIQNYTFIENSDNTQGNMTKEEMIVTYYYAKNTKVKVRYLEKGTNQVLAEESEIVGYEGKEYETEAKEISSYTNVENSNNTKGNMTKEEIVVTYYYAKNTKVVVKYLEKDTNQVLAEQTQIEGYVGKEYQTEEKQINGYTYVESSNNMKGNMTEEEITVIYYYLQNARAKVEHIDQDTKEILKEEIIEGKVGDVYQTKAIDIEGYILVKSPEKSEVTLEKGKEPVVKYYYQYVAAGVMEKHINQITGEVLAFKLTKGEKGDPYESKAKEFEGYDLVEIPSNSKGEMTEERIEVKYYYKRKVTLRVRYIDQETGKELIEDQITNGHEKDSYETKEKTFENYELVEKPENATGKLEISINADGTIHTQTVVTYYYTAKAGGVIERHIDEKTGKILEEKQHSGKVGDRYEIVAKEIEGYELNEKRLPENYTGIMGKEVIEVTYYYQKVAKVRVEYIDIQTGEKLHTEEIKGKEGDHYETEAKELDGYDLVEIPSNEKGNMTEKEIVVKYYYIQKAEVEIEYREKGSNILLKETQKIEGHVGDKYETKAEEIAYYHNRGSTQNETGNMTQEKIKVIYYYEKQNFNLKVEGWVENAIVNGVSQGVRNEGIYKIEINRNKMETAIVKVTYKIRISNLGEIEGAVKKLSQTIPTGYCYEAEDNKLQWKEENGVLTTEDLGEECIQPGEKKEIRLVLRWKAKEENLGQKDSVVVLSQMKNSAGFVDTNKEDNGAKASMIITIATGLDRNDRIVIIGVIQIVMVITIGILLHNKKKEQ
ncbi:MAG: Cna B-type domain-containing protein [Clostridia bacterium]|nr:Cna B-type domain-containing protein [Clostridia bacterium]